MRSVELRWLSSSLLALTLAAPACQSSGLTAAGELRDSGGIDGVDGPVSTLDGSDAGVDGPDAGVDGPDARVDGPGASDGGVDAEGKPSWRPSTCDDPELGQIPNADEFNVAKLVVGKWFNCDPLSMFQTTDDIGVELLDDGNWYKLYWTGTEVVRGVGFQRRGTWTSYSGGICCSVSLEALGAGGGLAIWPAFATSPRKMQVITSAGGFRTTLATGEH